ncbi:MAG: hypothetical protein U1E52_21415 [Geminicoccaceae bacterium]
MHSRRSPLLILLTASAAFAAISTGAPAVHAASSKGCAGGGFSVVGAGNTLSGAGRFTIPFGNLQAPFLVKGKYVEFTVVPASFAVRNYTFTGAANPLDQTGGVRTVLFAGKTPDHAGLILSSNAGVELKDTDIELSRTGPGLSMKLQAKDCANGGIFQMEVERSDGQRTRFTHVLGPNMFYFDNPNFRAREGDSLPYVTAKVSTTVVVGPRTNIANDVSSRLVARDSPQVATEVLQPQCATPIRKRDGTVATVQRCGNFSVWDVASGGRMGGVTGEDATEVAPPASACTSKCQAQNQVRGGAVVLGFPFPVPAASRLPTAAAP